MPNIIVLPVQQRSGMTVVDSWKAPKNLNKRFVVRVIMSSIDQLDPSNEVKLDTFISDDNLNWSYYAGLTWKGGDNLNRDGSPSPGPGFCVDGREVADKYLKGEITVPKAMSFGCELETQ